MKTLAARWDFDFTPPGFRVLGFGVFVFRLLGF